MEGRSIESSVEVRAALPSDLPALGRLGALLVSIHHGYDELRFIAPFPDIGAAYASFLERQLERPEALILVAEDRDSVAGYAYAAAGGSDFMALRGPAAMLYDLIVDPDRRGRGIGGRLLEAVATSFRSRGAPRIILSTAARNEAAQRLFASAGYRCTMIEMTRELE